MGKAHPKGDGGIGDSLKSSLSKFTGRVPVKAPSAEEAAPTSPPETQAASSIMSQPKPMTSPQGSPSAANPTSGPAPAPQKAPAPPSQATAAPTATNASEASERSTPANGNISKLANDVSIEGSLRYPNRLIFDGKLKGEIKSDGYLSVQSQAYVEAIVSVKTLLVEGKIVGNIFATESVRLAPSAIVVGDITTASLTVEPNASFTGQAKIGKPSVAPKQSPAETPKQSPNPAAQENSPQLPGLSGDKSKPQLTSKMPAPPANEAKPKD